MQGIKNRFDLPFSQLFLALACLVSGIFAGSMLFIGMSIIPYWSDLPPSEFHLWFAQSGHYIGNFMVPIAVLSCLFGILSTLLNCTKGNRRRLWLASGTLALLAVLVVYRFGNAPINLAFANTSALPDEIIREQLDHWTKLHWIRIGLGLFGFTAFTAASLTHPKAMS